VVGKDEAALPRIVVQTTRAVSLVSRRVNSLIPTFENLGLPPVIERLCNFSEGLVILSGVTGSGKSTTIRRCWTIQCREPLHILTVERPD